MKSSWQSKVLKYCEKYNIPLKYLPEILYEPKVVPMIRGKAFEFTVYDALKKILDPNSWDVTKPIMNAQLGFHDIDVMVKNKRTNKVIRIECKLAKKEGYRFYSDGSE